MFRKLFGFGIIHVPSLLFTVERLFLRSNRFVTMRIRVRTQSNTTIHRPANRDRELIAPRDKRAVVSTEISVSAIARATTLVNEKSKAEKKY